MTTPLRDRVQTLTCGRCGCDWTRPMQRGGLPRLCPQCRRVKLPVQRMGGGRNRATPGIDVNTAAFRVAWACTVYRLAIEEATCALKLGRPAEALAALERVAAPAR